MPRSVNHVASRNRRKKILSLTRGNFGGRANVWTVAKNTWEKGLQYAYRDRKNKKTHLPCIVDSTYQRRCAFGGIELQPIDGRVEESWYRNQPQGPRRFGDEPTTSFQSNRRAS